MRKILSQLKIAWSFTRVLRLLLGAILLGEAIYKTDWMFGVLGVVLLAQAVFNVGCCGAGICDTNHYRQRPKSSDAALKNTTFTEVQ
jgi:hypothetical protein